MIVFGKGCVSKIRIRHHRTSQQTFSASSACPSRIVTMPVKWGYELFSRSQVRVQNAGKPMQVFEGIELCFCGNSHYSNHLVSFTSEWTRGSDLKIFNKNNNLVETAGIEPAMLLIKSLGCVSMLAGCCDFSRKNIARVLSSA